ncbi:dynein light chain LC8-type [Paragonimus westermani]|uniref:Dynein light chain n=1 Tax=Paragonimus westermani TaxID=34504 RepID=A0A5J4NYN9_9TREM|nr:dynein light chain LC8-type [Paragonimus westermani]
MPKDMENNALNSFKDACQTLRESKKLASHMKKHFDSFYGRNWQCIVGRDFGR